MTSGDCSRRSGLGRATSDGPAFAHMRGLVANGPDRIAVMPFLPTNPSDTPSATGSVTAPLGDEGIMALTDSATWGMLRAILPGRGQQLQSFELMHTRSVPALRAFIEGENHLLANQWTEAEQAYARASTLIRVFGCAAAAHVRAARRWADVVSAGDHPDGELGGDPTKPVDAETGKRLRPRHSFGDRPGEA